MIDTIIDGMGNLVLLLGVFLLLYLVLRNLAAPPRPARQQRRAWDEADSLIKKAYMAEEGQKQYLLQRGLSLAQQSGDGILASEAACLLGELHLKNKRYAEAAQMFEFALELKTRMGWHPDKPNFEALIRRQLDEARNAGAPSGDKR